MRVAGGHASPRRRRSSIPIGKRRRPSPHNPPISLIPQPPIPIQSHSTSSYLTSEYWVAFPGGFPGGFCCPTRGDESKALAISSIGGLLYIYARCALSRLAAGVCRRACRLGGAAFVGSASRAVGLGVGMLAAEGVGRAHLGCGVCRRTRG